MDNPKTKNQLADLISPETRNILEKYRRLSMLCTGMGIEGKYTTDLIYLIEKLPTIKHKDQEEAMNLVTKLIKINKK